MLHQLVDERLHAGGGSVDPPRLCLGMRPIQVYVGVFRSLIYSVRGALHRHRETVPTPRLRYVQVSLAQVDYLGKFGIA